MMKKKRTKGKLLAALLAMTAMFAVGAFASPVHAEDTYQISGEYTLVQGVTDPSIKSLPSADKLQGTTFTLYKVGHFGQDSAGNSILVLEDSLSSLSGRVDLNDSNHHKDPSEMGETEKQEWTKTWLASALAIDNVVKAHKDQFEVASTAEIDASGKFTLTAPNGLYLLSGDSCVIDEYPNEGEKTYWEPQPMLVQVLNGNQDVGVKPVAVTVTKFRVTKVWKSDKHVKDQVRPKSIDLIIRYDEKPVAFSEDGKPIKTSEDSTVSTKVKLPRTGGDESDTWAFSWESTADFPDPTKWSVEEILTTKDALNYVAVVDPLTSETLKSFTVTNTYSRQQLELKKNTDRYLQSDETLASAAVFEITGLDADQKQVYHTKRGVQISGPGASDPVYVDIPANVVSIKVKEIYKGANYEPVEAEQDAKYTPPEFNEDGTLKNSGLFEVTFENKYKGSTHYNDGIVNKFKMSGDNYKYDDGKDESPK